MPTLRPFHRADRDQLTDLINLHVAAVVPGVSVSVNTVLSSLERQPDEFITDPWVAERVTLVAEQRRHLVAAAHLLRYRADDEVGEDYRGAGEISWFVCRPEASFLPDTGEAAASLMHACLARLARWDVRVRHADGALPAPAVYGLPHPWPHIRAVYENAGFRHTGDTELLLIAHVADLPRPEPRPGVTVERTLGECGTRFTARRDSGDVLGFIEIDTALARPERHTRTAGLADIGNLVVVAEAAEAAEAAETAETAGDGGGGGIGDHDARDEHHGDAADAGWERWLIGQAADWLRLCGADRLLAYEDPEDRAAIDVLTAAGFRELTRTDRGWRHGADTG
ncbi:N-acetyltransferase [Streptomyces sp. NPDC088789]|uniref:N-acetyltransferase n=1 Tax=Streptomyces sp. NPDC088789 TaxID=3365899 RepID=UPI0037FDCF4C